MQLPRESREPDLIRFESSPSPIGRLILGALWVNSTGPQHMRRMTSYCATLTTSGLADYRSPVGGNHTIRPGDLVLVFPNVPHFYGPAHGHRWSEFFVNFEGPAFDLLMERGVLDPAKPVCHLEPVEYWLRRLREIVENPLRGGPELVAGRVCQLLQFLVDAVASHKQKLDGTENLPWLAEAKALLDCNGPEGTLSLQQVADRLFISYETFRKKFVRLTGISPGAYRIHRAVERAAHLAIERRDMPLKEIASRCGFCNEFYLSRQFKQVLRVSPSELRRRCSGAGRN